MRKTKLTYLAILLLIIILGLTSRTVPYVPEQAGDAFWTMALFCVLRMAFYKTELTIITFASIIISFADEFSQLIRWPWLCEIRATTIGHLILGQGFNAWDLVAYTIGALVMWGIARRVER